MNEDIVYKYLEYLWNKYNGEKNTDICRLLDELREKFYADIRDIVIGFSNEEIHDLHMCISECINYHTNSKKHKKEHPDGKCTCCENYKKIWDRIVKYCDCVDNPDL